MWIRSQDKNNLRDYQGINGDSDTVWGDANNSNDSYVLGQYKNKDRIKEVMNEIQNCIEYNEHYSHSGISTLACQGYAYFVYEMPKE